MNTSLDLTLLCIIEYTMYRTKIGRERTYMKHPVAGSSRTPTIPTANNCPGHDRCPSYEVMPDPVTNEHTDKRLITPVVLDRPNQYCEPSAPPYAL